MSVATWFERRTIRESGGFLHWRLAPGGTAEIVEIEVFNEHRRQGVGRRLLERMLTELPEETKTIYAFTRETNGNAISWYSANDFRMVLAPSFYADGDTAVLCWRFIGGRLG